MSLFDDYKRHRDRYNRLRKLNQLLGSEYECCPWCGRPHVRLEMHHYAREKHDPIAVIACRDCHDRFRDREQFEHPPLTEDLGDHRERQRRQLLAFADMLEFVANELRSIVNSITYKMGTKIIDKEQ
nr:hypothetical protein [uncultured Hyphomonas sp.]